MPPSVQVGIHSSGGEGADDFPRPLSAAQKSGVPNVLFSISSSSFFPPFFHRADNAVDKFLARVGFTEFVFVDDLIVD